MHRRAGADDDLATEERRLDGNPATPQRGVEMRALEAIVEGLEAQAGEERRRRRGIGRRRPDDGAEAARIGEAQRAARRDEVEVVVRAGFGSPAPKESDPDMPRCINRPPRSSASQRYLPRRLTSPTRWPTMASGVLPSGQRSGLPTRTAVTRAPRIRSAKLSRVTSTSGSSGMGGWTGAR